MTPTGDGSIPAWRRYLRFWRASPAADVHDELAFHLDSAVDELVASGMARDEARAAARQRFGDLARIQTTLNTLSVERERHMARRDWWQTIAQDLRFGIRQLRKAPAFTTVALLTLALGIGANSAIFSVIYSVMLKPLPYADASRTLLVREKNGSHGDNAATFGNYASWRQQARSFEAIGASWGSNPLTLTTGGAPTAVFTTRATAGYWKALFIPPVLGRYFDSTEVQEAAPKVVVISYALWQTRFHGDSGIVGSSVVIGGDGYRVIGVASPDYILSPPAEKIWIPLVVPASKYTDHADHELTVYAKVRRGVPIARAAAELSHIERGLAQQYPHSGFDDVDALPLTTSIISGGGLVTLLYTLFVAVALVLLIACTNVANLLMARATARRGEMAIRSALGASRARIVAQLLSESLLLGLGGGALGLAVAWLAVRFLVTSPASMPRIQSAGLNAPVLAFTFGLALACTALFGVLPAVRAARLDLQQTLRDGGRESAVTQRERLRGVLVVGELVLSQVLLVAAGLMIRSWAATQLVPVGFDSHNLTVMDIHLPSSRYGAPGATEAGFQRLDAALASLPGVRSVGRASIAPIHGEGWNCATMRPGSNGHDDGAVIADMRAVNANYFTALDVPLLRGRAFGIGDVAGSPPVAIVTRHLATELFGGADPIGHTISSCIDGNDSSRVWREVVGVIGDMHADGLRDDPPPQVYMPSGQWQGSSQMTFVVRSALPSATLVPELRRAVASVDPMLPLSGVETMDHAIGTSLAFPRFTMFLLTMLGATGLLLVVVGVYGVIAYFMNQRTHELGVRLALGASTSGVQWLVVRQGLVLGAVGVVAGTAASLALTRFLGAFMFGVTPHDPLTFAAVAALLVVIAGLASYLPARRATRIDPLEALRAS